MILHGFASRTLKNVQATKHTQFCLAAENEVRVLNRVVRVVPNGVRYEADPRHHELLSRSLGVETATVTPGVKPGEESIAYKGEEHQTDGPVMCSDGRMRGVVIDSTGNTTLLDNDPHDAVIDVDRSTETVIEDTKESTGSLLCSAKLFAAVIGTQSCLKTRSSTTKSLRVNFDTQGAELCGRLAPPHSPVWSWQDTPSKSQDFASSN